MRLIVIAGTRSGFIKMASLMPALKRMSGIETMLIHTGQYSDWRMSGIFFRQLGIPDPDANLDVDAGSTAHQMTAVTRRFEEVLSDYRPDAVLAAGNLQNGIACVIAAARKRIKIIHLEAGMRSAEGSLPRDLQRILVDRISDLHFCSEPQDLENLRREGIHRPPLVGSILIDTLLRYRERAEASKILPALELAPGGYAVATLHRQSNVDDPVTFSRLLSALKTVGRDMPMVFPMHLRTRQKLSDADMAAGRPGLRFIDPLGYFDFIKLIGSARVVLTDSGGVQEETTVLGVPCLTLLENTDRRCTVETGSNRVVGTDSARILEAWRATLAGTPKAIQLPPLWDGHAADRIAGIIAEEWVPRKVAVA
jgi:UDP-N-acetylglucosamine 2-epimerase (non-hydrolysing)